MKTTLIRWPAPSASSDRVGPGPALSWRGLFARLILRDFFLHGPRRFQQLQDSLKGIAPNTLSERLRTLEENGVVERRFYSMSPPRAEYVLTAKGRELGPIVRAMRDWGRKWACTGQGASAVAGC